MNRQLKAEPKSDAELFDMLHSLFGIGDYDAADPEGKEWFRFRMLEITKLKAIRKRRAITLDDFALTARYCFRHRIDITQPYQLIKHILDARRERRLNTVADIEAEVRVAVETERSRGDEDSQWWIERLLRARGPFRRNVLDEWLDHDRHETRA